MKKVLLLVITFIFVLSTPVMAQDLKGRATVYTNPGKTYLETDVRYGICATGNKDLLGKYVILFKRLPDGSHGDCLGIFHVEDTGCKEEVIDIWSPEILSQKIIDRTYEDGCEGKIYIRVVDE